MVKHCLSVVVILFLSSCGGESQKVVSSPIELPDSSPAVSVGTDLPDIKIAEETQGSHLLTVEPVVLESVAQVSAECPAFSEKVSPNSQFSFEVKGALSERDLPDKISVSLHCDSMPQSGDILWNGSQFSFIPDQELPPGSACELEVTSERDSTISGLNEKFEVAETRKEVMSYSQPSLVDGGSAYSTAAPSTVLADGDTVVLINRAPFSIMVSKDRGGTFDQLDFDGAGGSSGQVSAVIKDGELYLAWRILNVNSTSEVVYVRTTDGMKKLSVPVLLTNPYDYLHGWKPSVAVKDSGEIYVSWEEFCLHVGRFCTWDENGYYLGKINADDDMVSVERIAGFEGKDGQMLLTKNGILVALLHQDSTGTVIHGQAVYKNTIGIYNYSEGMQEIFSVPVSEGTRNPGFLSMDLVTDETAQIIWTIMENDKRKYFSTVFDINGDSIDPSFRYDVASLVTDSHGSTAWIQDEVMHVRNSSSRKVDKYSLQIPSPPNDDLEGVKDLSFGLAFWENKESILVWQRMDNRGEREWDEVNFPIPFAPYKLMMAKGRPASPCEKY